VYVQHVDRAILHVTQHVAQAGAKIGQNERQVERVAYLVGRTFVMGQAFPCGWCVAKAVYRDSVYRVVSASAIGRSPHGWFHTAFTKPDGQVHEPGGVRIALPAREIRNQK